MKLKYWGIIFSFILAFQLIGQGNVFAENKSSEYTAATEKTVKKVTVNTKKLTLKQNSQEQIVLTATYQDGTTEDVTSKAKWTTSKKSIAEVNNGLVTAKSKGKTTVKAQYGKKSASISVTVDGLQVQSISSNKASVNLKTGGKEQVELTATYDDGSSEKVTDKAEWKSDDTKIAEVVGGLITAVTPGTTAIKATFGGKETTITVTVEGASSQNVFTFTDNEETNLESFVDVTGGELKLESGNFEFKVNVRDIPEKLTFNHEKVQDNMNEYNWEVKVEDAKHTFQMSTTHFKFPGAKQTEGTIADNTQTDVWKRDGNSTKRLYGVNLVVNMAENYLVISGKLPDDFDFSTLKSIKVKTFHTDGEKRWSDEVTVK